MNHPLQFTAKDRDEVNRLVAEMIFQRLTFDIEELIVIPTATVAQCTGLQPKSVSRRLPITTISTQKKGVVLKTLREYLKKNTRPPSA